MHVRSAAEQRAWLDQVREAPIDPDRPIIDPHHHLWTDAEGRQPYLLADLWADTGSGHRITQTVFIECRSSYRVDGPEHLKPIGETEFVARIACASREGGGGAVIAGFVGHADLRLPRAQLNVVLDAHVLASGGLFRGIRYSISCDPDPQALSIPGRAPAGLARDPAFRAGVAQLGERGLTYDCWLYHHQIAEYTALAQATPGTTFVFDHFGTPLGVGAYAGRREAIFATWQREVEALARLPNVVAKLGGLAMPDNGFGWNERNVPPGSDELVEAQARWYRHAIECFGAERCMFESNFPVDRRSLPYGVYWNAMKKIAARYTEAERQAMFEGTARRVYRL